MTAKFEIGKTYITRSACDYECIFAWTVISRTAKQVTLEDRHGRIMRRGVKVYDATEFCMPLGSYSMAPCIHAKRFA